MSIANGAAAAAPVAEDAADRAEAGVDREERRPRDEEDAEVGEVHRRDERCAHAGALENGGREREPDAVPAHVEQTAPRRSVLLRVGHDRRERHRDQRRGRTGHQQQRERERLGGPQLAVVVAPRHPDRDHLAQDDERREHHELTEMRPEEVVEIADDPEHERGEADRAHERDVDHESLARRRPHARVLSSRSERRLSRF